MKGSTQEVRLADHFPKMFIAQSAIVIVALLLVHFLKVPLGAYTFTDPLVILLATLAAVMTYLLIFSITISRNRMGRAVHTLTQKIQPMFAGLSWTQILIIAILAGVGEELFFRGFLQTWIIGKTQIWIGIISASLVFGLLHYVNFTYFIITFILGIALGIVYHLSNDLALVILWHAIYDVLAIAVLSRYPHWLGIKLNHS